MVSDMAEVEAKEQEVEKEEVHQRTEDEEQLDSRSTEKGRRKWIAAA